MKFLKERALEFIKNVLCNQTFSSLFIGIIITLHWCSSFFIRNNIQKKKKKIKALKGCFNTLQPVDKAFSLSHSLI